MAVRSACIAVTLLLLSSAPALAQWNPGFTASLGRGYGNIALSQSILSNTRALSNSRTPDSDGATGSDTRGGATGSGAHGGTAASGARGGTVARGGTADDGTAMGNGDDAATAGAASGRSAGLAGGTGSAGGTAWAGSAAPAPASAAGSASLAGGAHGAPTLTYIPDQAVSDRMRAETIDALSRTLPHLRGQMEQSFAGNAVLREFDHRMSSRGYSSHNVADDMAELLVVSWEITTGGAAQGAQVQGAHRQVRDIFLGNSRLRAMTNTERQEMAERIAYQVVISSLAHKEYLRSGDRVQLAGLQQVVTTMLRQQGIDLTSLRLTPQGFHR
jgi:hypothetical protein